MTSSWIESFSYDATTGNLDIETKSGAVYTYGDVPQHIADGMSNADSKGSYHNANIRGRYDCVRG